MSLNIPLKEFLGIKTIIKLILVAPGSIAFIKYRQQCQKKGLVDSVYAYQVSFGLASGKSSIVFKGHFFP
jgi:hypothetical protein